MTALLLPPLRSATLTQKWGPTPHKLEPRGYGQLGRFWWNPYDGFYFYWYYHPGLDLAAPKGTPIYASQTSIIVALGPNGSSGLRFNCQIRPGTLFVGGHLNDIATKPGAGRDWRVGDKILRGQGIATVGDSGDATGDHLHFGIQSKVPGTNQDMIYDPGLFGIGPRITADWGNNANDPRFLPYY
jgi:murein DD-endopeptidase MepM/ murein hydrolase activator NlpD